MSIISLSVEGKTYNSIKEACKAYGISPQCFHYRVFKRGMSVEDALKSPKHIVKKEITINGVTYPSVQAACRAYNISNSTFEKRVYKKGIDVETALMMPTEKPLFRGKKVAVGEVSYDSVKEACKVNHIKENTYYKRIRSGMTSEEALKVADFRKNKQRKGKSVTIDGIYYPNIRFALDALHLSMRTVYSRMERTGCSIEEALTQEKKNEPKETVINGITFPTRSAAIKHFRVPQIYNVMNREQLSFEDAVMFILEKREKRKTRTAL